MNKRSTIGLFHYYLYCRKSASELLKTSLLLINWEIERLTKHQRENKKWHSTETSVIQTTDAIRHRKRKLTAIYGILGCEQGVSDKTKNPEKSSYRNIEKFDKSNYNKGAVKRIE